MPIYVELIRSLPGVGQCKVKTSASQLLHNYVPTTANHIVSFAVSCLTKIIIGLPLRDVVAGTRRVDTTRKILCRR